MSLVLRDTNKIGTRLPAVRGLSHGGVRMGPGQGKKKHFKHGVSFEEAVTVFDDPFFVSLFDLDHSENEHRFIAAGISRRNRLLLVSYTERGDIIRIISAREATRAEKQVYEEGYQ